MKVTCVGNDTMRLLLIPSGEHEEIEAVFLRKMAEASEKGTRTILEMPAVDGREYVLEVGGKP